MRAIKLPYQSTTQSRKEGTDAYLAGRYLREIISATMELDRITDEARSRADRFRPREREGRP